MMKLITTFFCASILLNSCQQNKSKETVPEVTVVPKAQNNIEQLVNDYIILKDAFIKEKIETIDSANALLLTSSKIDSITNNAKVVNKMELLNATNAVNNLTAKMKSLTTIEEKRKVFKEMTASMKTILNNSNNTTLYVQHCPMAFNNTGATWISRDGEEKIRNPFLPKTMLQCGDVTDTLNVIK